MYIHIHILYRERGGTGTHRAGEGVASRRDALPADGQDGVDHCQVVVDRRHRRRLSATKPHF